MKAIFRSIILCFIFLSAYSVDRTRWESSHYVWDFGLITACDKGITKNPANYFATESPFNKEAYHDVKAGDVVWVQCKFLNQFYHEVLPTLKHPIVLLISDGDESFPSDSNLTVPIEDFLNHPNIAHIFAQNNDYNGPSNKVSHLPIGIDLHTIAYKGVRGGWGEQGSPPEQEAQLNTVLKQLKPTHARKKKAFVDFQHADTMHGEFKRYLQWGEDRQTIFKKLLPTGLIDYGPWVRRSELWKRKGQYAFSISPHGNGLDCHRTWEDLILGCIVIVKTSPLDPLYEGLPVVIVNEWSEVTQENMNRWLEQYGDAFTNPTYREKLTLNYWLSKIRAVSEKIKAENRIPEKVLICGVCKDVEQRLPYSINIMEKIGNLFKDHRIIVYENNSIDKTPELLRAWESTNPKVQVISENIEQDELEKLFINRKKNKEFHISEPIARARNIVLDIAFSKPYQEYQYIIWMDMDFKLEPNYAGFEEVFKSDKEWDAVFAYGIDPRPIYWDWYALRDDLLPLGSELLGNYWWYLPKKLVLSKDDAWYPVYSAFGGCGIYKKSSIENCRYSALVTKDLAQLYQKLIQKHCSHSLVQKYFRDTNHLDCCITIDSPHVNAPDIYNPNIGIKTPDSQDVIWRMSSFVYRYPSVCEHVPFHASMIARGHDKLFINPRLIFRYSR